MSFTSEWGLWLLACTVNYRYNVTDGTLKKLCYIRFYVRDRAQISSFTQKRACPFGGEGVWALPVFFIEEIEDFFSTRCEDRSQSEECSKACRKGGTLKVLWRSASTVRSIFVGTSMTRPLRCGCTWLFRCACPVRAESSSRSLGHGVGSCTTGHDRTATGRVDRIDVRDVVHDRTW